MTITLRCVLALCAVLILAGCSSSGGRLDGRPVDSDEQQESELASLLPPPSTLAPAKDAQASIMSVKMGRDTSERSGNTEIADESLNLNSGPQECAWAIYHFDMPMGVWDNRIELSFFSDEADSVWLAWSDFQLDTWQMQELSAGQPFLQLGSGPWVAAGDNLFVAMLAYGGDGITVESLTVRLTVPSWQLHTPEPLITGGRWTSLAVVAGLPSIVCHDFGGLHYYLGSTAAPSDWTAWTDYCLDPDLDGCEGTSLASINGKPAVAYARQNVFLRYARAAVAAPEFPEDWTITELDDGNASHYPSLAEIGGNPAIAYCEGFVDDEPALLRFAQAGVPEPSLLDWTFSAILDCGAEFANDAKNLSLVSLDGVPAFCFYEYGQQDLYFMRAQTSNPAGAADWEHSLVEDANRVGSHCQMRMVNGVPMIAYYDANLSEPFRRLSIAIGGDPAPATGADFNLQVVDADGNVGIYPSIAEVQGRPAIAYRETDTGTIHLAWARHDQPLSSADWQVWTAVPSCGDDGGYISLAAVGGWPALTYYDSDLDAMRYARMVP